MCKISPFFLFPKFQTNAGTSAKYPSDQPPKGEMNGQLQEGAFQENQHHSVVLSMKEIVLTILFGSELKLFSIMLTNVILPEIKTML